MFQGEARKYDALWRGCALAEIQKNYEDFGSPEATVADGVV